MSKATESMIIIYRYMKCMQVCTTKQTIEAANEQFIVMWINCYSNSYYTPHWIPLFHMSGSWSCVENIEICTRCFQLLPIRQKAASSELVIRVCTILLDHYKCSVLALSYFPDTQLFSYYTISLCLLSRFWYLLSLVHYLLISRIVLLVDMLLNVLQICYTCSY